MIGIIDVILAIFLVALIINEIIREKQREKEYKAKLNEMEKERSTANDKLLKTIHKLQQVNNSDSNKSTKNN